jgi:hypothetical protein
MVTLNIAGANIIVLADNTATAALTIIIIGSLFSFIRLFIFINLAY